MESTRSIVSATLLLMVAYYVFDLDYPAIYGQFVGVLQHWVIRDIFTQNKCTNWINFSDQACLRNIKKSLSFVYSSLLGFFSPQVRTNTEKENIY